MKKYIEFVHNELNIWMAELDDRIVEVSFLKPDNYQIIETELLIKAKNEIIEFLEGKREYFDLPILTIGTQFQKNVWDTLLKIPYGKVVSYKDVALMLGRNTGFRAIGMACNKNNIPIIIPCHRVVGVNGLGGYSAGIEIKKKLLEIEKKHQF